MYRHGALDANAEAGERAVHSPEVAAGSEAKKTWMDLRMHLYAKCGCAGMRGHGALDAHLRSARG